MTNRKNRGLSPVFVFAPVPGFRAGFRPIFAIREGKTSFERTGLIVDLKIGGSFIDRAELAAVQ